MFTRLIAGLSAFAITAVTLPLVLRLARMWNLYDAEGPLKIHTRRIPRLGGVALLAGLSAGILSARLLASAADGFGAAWFPLTVIVVVWATGLADDIRDLAPVARLVVQLGAGFVLWKAGWTVPLFTGTILNPLCTCFFVATFVNAFNLLDGADGIAASVSLIIALGYTLFSSGEVSVMGGLLAASIAGCCMGFLIFNFPPARIFMGDSGSTLLGVSLASLSLDFYKTAPAVSSRLMLPVLFAALPLLDLGLAILRRLRKGASLFSGDRQHFYDLLLQRGWPARRVTVVCALFTAILVGAGYWGYQQDSLISTLILILGIAPLVMIAISLGSLRTDPGMRGNGSRA